MGHVRPLLSSREVPSCAAPLASRVPPLLSFCGAIDMIATALAHPGNGDPGEAQSAATSAV
jgi:hypothetical protein